MLGNHPFVYHGLVINTSGPHMTHGPPSCMFGLNEIQEENKIRKSNFFKKVFQVANSGTPVCMVRLDSQTLQVKWQILLKKIKQVRKTMDNCDNNIF